VVEPDLQLVVVVAVLVVVVVEAFHNLVDLEAFLHVVGNLEVLRLVDQVLDA
jgi:hypothetical protein